LAEIEFKLPEENPLYRQVDLKQEDERLMGILKSIKRTLKVNYLILKKHFVGPQHLKMITVIILMLLSVNIMQILMHKIIILTSAEQPSTGLLKQVIL
jgi:hypothetical protein